MKYLDLSLPTPAANLACDEALLDGCEDGWSDEVLRFWESPQPFVVLGYANRAGTEVNLEVCRERHVPVLRRCSGGGTVLQGPGCLNYSLILRIEEHGPRPSIAGTNRLVMEAHRQALSSALQKPVELLGHTDLALERLKFSGNAQRRRKHSLLFHGTFLLHFDLALIETLLPLPTKQPEYRRHRSHHEFLTNLNAPAALIKEALRKTWTATDPFDSLSPALHNATAKLVEEKYSTPEWNLKF